MLGRQSASSPVFKTLGGGPSLELEAARDFLSQSKVDSHLTVPENRLSFCGS